MATGKSKPSETCDWILDEHYDSWTTTCGNEFQFFAEGPKENNFKFCPYCGRKLKIGSA